MAETTLGVVLLLVVVPVLRLQDVVLDTTLVLRALSLTVRGLREIRALVLSALVLLHLLFTLPMSRWLGTGFRLTPVSDHLLTHLTVDFFAGTRYGGHLDHGLRLLQAHDGAAQMVLQPHPDERE